MTKTQIILVLIGLLIGFLFGGHLGGLMILAGLTILILIIITLATKIIKGEL